MNRPAVPYRLLLLLALICSVLASGFAAEELEESIRPEEPTSSQPELERPAVVGPKKTRPHRRPKAAQRSKNDRVEIGQDVVIAAGETVDQLVVIAGNVTIDGTVAGDLVVVSGNAKINGQVKQDLVTILGSVSLGPEARVGQDLTVVGGPLRAHHEATIGGGRRVVTLGQMTPDFVWLQKWLAKGLFLARPFPPGVRWVWIVAALFLVLYLVMTLMFPRPVQACVHAVEERPVASFFLGLMLLVILGPLLFLLIISFVGVLAIPFVVCALIAAALFGKVAVYSYAGQQLGRQIHVPDLSLPIVLIIGSALFYAIYMVPVLGFAVWGVVTIVGFGAVLLAAFSSFRREEPPPYAPAHTLNVDVSETEAGHSSAGPKATAVPLPAAVLTTDQAALLPRVGFWRRLCATFLDCVLLILLIRFTGALFLVLWAAYHIAMWTWKGTTIGGIVMGIKIVRVDGEPISFAVALVRSLSSFFSAFALFLGFFWAGWDRERQAWHDKIAGTVVIRVPKSISLI